jgi:enoyl-CoA hydratase/carnithine racemase
MNAQALASPGPALIVKTAENGICTVTLNRPERRNPLSEAVLDALEAALAQIATDPAIKAVILVSTGAVFCAGHDLKEMTAHRSDSDNGRAYFASTLDQCSRVMQMIVSLPQPVIAAIEGTATAAGCQMVASCDLALAGQDAKFCTPGVHIGLFCSTPMVPLSRNLSRKHAMEMLLLGEMVGAMDALRLGLINRVVPAGSALDAARDMAQVIAAKASATVKIGKRAFYEQIEMPLAQAYQHATQVMVENMLAREAQEGIGAFLGRREPLWADAPE